MAAKFLGLRTTIYKVPDMAAAKEWYSKAFEAQPYFDEPYHIGFTIAGYELGLQPDETGAESKTGNVLTYWGTDKIDEAYQRFLELGATEDEAPVNVGGEIVIGSVKDPWGNVIGLIYNPDFKAE